MAGTAGAAVGFVAYQVPPSRLQLLPTKPFLFSISGNLFGPTRCFAGTATVKERKETCAAASWTQSETRHSSGSAA